jgi:hypothetical protein
MAKRKLTPAPADVTGDQFAEPAGQAEQQPEAELRRQLNEVVTTLIALGMELPDPAKLANPAEAAAMRRQLLRYLAPAQDRLSDYERLLTGQSRLRWFR